LILENRNGVQNKTNFPKLPNAFNIVENSMNIDSPKINGVLNKDISIAINTLNRVDSNSIKNQRQ
jgi:hypothetical protein